MSEASGSHGKREKESAEELLARLTLQEEEEDDFIWEEELPDMLEPAKWLAIVRVHTLKSFSPNALYNDMRAAWNPAKSVTWRKIKANLFTAQFGCLGDWNKAMAEGPWLFRDQAVIMQEYDGFKNPDAFKLDKLSVWAQIHRLPDKFLIEPAVKGLASRIGEVEEIQLKLPAGFFGEFVRVKVKIDIHSKIKRFVTAKKGEERVQYQVKYEKLPIFCFNCGEFGHWHEECGEGEHDEAKFEWGDFVMADNFRFNTAGRGNHGPQRGRGGQWSGGRGRGREPYNPNQSWRFNARPPMQTEQEPSSEGTEQNGGKVVPATGVGVVSIANQGSNKRLSVENITSPRLEVQTGGMRDALEVVTIRDQLLVPPPPPVYVSPRKENKRSKKGLGEDGSAAGKLKTGEDDSNEKTMNATSAGSSEEYRRAQ